MSDDWLAVWDAAEETERIAILALITHKITSWTEAEVIHRLAKAERPFAIEVIEARREQAGHLTVITSASLRLHYIPLSGGDWHAHLVAIDETVVDGTAWVRDRRLWTGQIVVQDAEITTHVDTVDIRGVIADWRASPRPYR